MIDHSLAAVDKDELEALQAVARVASEFRDDETCRYDHNDYCQTHYGERPCHMARLRIALDHLYSLRPALRPVR